MKAKKPMNTQAAKLSTGELREKAIEAAMEWESEAWWYKQSEDAQENWIGAFEMGYKLGFLNKVKP